MLPQEKMVWLVYLNKGEEAEREYIDSSGGWMMGG